MKKGFFVILAVFLLAPLWAQTASDFAVTLNEAGDGVVITGYEGRVTAVRIPATIEGLPVRVIRGMHSSKYYYEDFAVTSVVIPEGITAIGNEALSRFHRLTSVTLPSSLKTIGREAFTGCQRLQSISLPAGLSSIGYEAFSNTGIRSIILPAGITAIEDGTFYVCRNLQSIVIPEGVTRIGNSAFSNCEALTSISLPSTIAHIGSEAFRGCSVLTTVTIPQSVESIEIADDAFGFSPTRLNLASQAALKRVGYKGRF